MPHARGLDFLVFFTTYPTFLVCAGACSISLIPIAEVQSWRTVDCALKDVVLEVACPRRTRSHDVIVFATPRFSHASTWPTPCAFHDGVSRQRIRASTFLTFGEIGTPYWVLQLFDATSFQFFIHTLQMKVLKKRWGYPPFFVFNDFVHMNHRDVCHLLCCSTHSNAACLLP